SLEPLLQAFRIVLQDLCRRVLHGGILQTALIVSRDITLAVLHALGAEAFIVPRLVDWFGVRGDWRVREPSVSAVLARSENRRNFCCGPGDGRPADKMGILARSRLGPAMAGGVVVVAAVLDLADSRLVRVHQTPRSADRTGAGAKTRPAFRGRLFLLR